jgi:hypothetical protein
MKHSWWLGLCLLGLPVLAQTDLNQVMRQIDQSASQKDLTALVAYYSPEFKNNDGLNKAKFSDALQTFWKNLEKPTYTTQILTTKTNRNQTTLRTRTTVAGNWKQDRYRFDLKSTVEAESIWQKNGDSWQMVSQTILSERTEIQNGAKPPQPVLTLPATVKAGQSYELQAILPTPLDEQLVLGGLTQFPATQPGTTSLDGLQSGGFFKRNTIPNKKEDQQVSIGFIKADGMYFVTQRLKVN